MKLISKIGPNFGLHHNFVKVGHWSWMSKPRNDLGKINEKWICTFLTLYPVFVLVSNLLFYIIHAWNNYYRTFQEPLHAKLLMENIFSHQTSIYSEERHTRHLKCKLLSQSRKGYSSFGTVAKKIKSFSTLLFRRYCKWHAFYTNFHHMYINFCILYITNILMKLNF